jgi:hypothetical protein
VSVLTTGLVLILLVPVPGRGLDVHSLVLPGAEVIGALVGIEAGEHARQVLGVLKILGKDRSGVGIGHHVIAKVLFAPRTLTSITHWNPTEWHSATFDPSMRMQSEFCKSCWKVVAPPRPKLVPRLGTVVARRAGRSNA